MSGTFRRRIYRQGPTMAANDLDGSHSLLEIMRRKSGALGRSAGDNSTMGTVNDCRNRLIREGRRLNDGGALTTRNDQAHQ